VTPLPSPTPSPTPTAPPKRTTAVAGTTGSGPAPGPSPDHKDRKPVGLVNEISDTVAAGVSTVVKPAAAAAVATTFSFPLALMVIVLLFLLVQSRVDRRDPRLKQAGGAGPEALLGFEDEDLL